MKILACCIGLIGLTFCTSQAYKIEINFTVEVEPNTAKDVELIETPFVNFAQLAQSLPNNSQAIRELTSALESNLTEILQICEKQQIKGCINCSINTDTCPPDAYIQ